MALDLQIPPLGKDFFTRTNQVDHVWYGFFKREYEGIKFLEKTLSNVYNLANTKMSGNTTGGSGGWEDLRAPATAVNPAGITDAPAYDETYVGYSFSASTNNRIDVIFQLPHGWKRGSNIRPHVHIRPLANSTGNVVWRLETAWSNSLDIQPAFSVSYSNFVVNVASNALAREFIHGLGNSVPPVNAKESSCVKYKLIREATSGGDNYTGAILLDEFDCHYYHEKAGTDPEYPI